MKAINVRTYEFTLTSKLKERWEKVGLTNLPTPHPPICLHPPPPSRPPVPVLRVVLHVGINRDQINWHREIQMPKIDF